MIAIYKRELRSFFYSFIGWIFLAATILMMGIYFTVYNFFYGYPQISYVCQSVVFLFLFTIPLLTMKVLSEDRKQKTDQLIFTAPISIGKVVIGKYLALVTILAIPTVLLGLTVPILSIFGTMQVGVSYTALLGFFLYGCLGLAVGLLVSSWTESMVIAAVVSLIFMFIGYLMSALCSLISESGNVLTMILSVFDMVGRFDDMATGLFSIPAVVYDVTFILFLLFATTQSIQKRRYSTSSKGLRVGAFSIGSLVVAAVLTILVNVVVNLLPESMQTLDVTANQMYTLTSDTKDFIANLDQDVDIYVWASETDMDTDVDKTIQRMADLSNHISVTYVDPIVNPRFYASYTDTEPSQNSVFVVGPERTRVVDYYDLYELEFDYSTYYYNVTGYDAEGQIVSAIAYVTTDDMPKIYIVTGHNELELEDSFLQAIQKENIEYEDLTLLTVDAVPDDAQAIILDAPINDYSSDDADKVIAYLEQGGKAIIIATWAEEEMTNFNRILAYYGVSIVDGMVVESDMSAYYGSPYFLLPDVYYDEMTADVYGYYIFMPYAMGLAYDDEDADYYYTPLLVTSDSAYSKTNLETSESFSKEDGDIDGPFVLAVRAERYLDDGSTSEAFIAAAEQMFTEAADDIVPGNNVQFFDDVLGTLVAHESSILVPVKTYDSSTIVFSMLACLIGGVVSIIVIPLACLIVGFVIWFRRRKL